MSGIPEPRHYGGFDVPTRWMSGVGAYAELDEDAFIDGALILSIGGAQQSHVDVHRPDRVFYEYLQRIAHVLDLVRPPGAPLRVLHLGAGALTLVRYVQAKRPGSRQVAVDIEGELLDFVLDIFADADAPAHLTGPRFTADLLRICAEDGVLLVNIGDDPPLRFAREQSRQIASLAEGTAVLTEAGMVGGELAGNVVVAARRTPWPESWTTALLARGPHPAAVLVGAGREAFERG